MTLSIKIFLVEFEMILVYVEISSVLITLSLTDEGFISDVNVYVLYDQLSQSNY
jgi:hypothetical protein